MAMVKRFFILFSCVVFTVTAQGLNWTVSGMRQADDDTSAIKYMRKDLNGDACALVKVQLSTNGILFEGNIVGEQEQKDEEYWVYMTNGSKGLLIKHPEYVPLHVAFADYGFSSVKGQMTYILTLKLPDDESTIFLRQQGLLDASAQELYETGKNYFSGTNGKGVDRTKSVICFRKAAELGHAESQNRLGAMYSNGQVVMQDYNEAVKWFRKSAEQGNALAQSNIGYHYLKGKGVTQNITEAFQWFQKSANQDEVNGLHGLAWMYENGIGIAQNYLKAMKYYIRAAEKGNASSQNSLGYMFEKGLGTVQDYKQAMKWYRMAAERGNAASQNNLGVMYEMGLGSPVDFAEAVRWYQLAAEQGLAEAQTNLGWMYESGQGVEENIEQAIYWYEKAAAQGNEDAKNALRELQ